MKWSVDCSNVRDTLVGTERIVERFAWFPRRVFAERPSWDAYWKTLNQPRPCTVWVWLEEYIDFYTWTKTNMGYRWFWRWRAVGRDR